MRERQPHPASPWRVIVWCAGCAIGIVLVVCAFAAVSMLRIATDLKRARTMIETASNDIHEGKLQDARDNLSSAERLLISANGRLFSRPEFDLIGWLPVVDQNLTSLQGSVATALQMVHGGNQLLEITRPLENKQGQLEISLAHGQIPLSTIRRAQSEAVSLANSLPGVGEASPSSHLLLGPVSDFQRRIFKEATVRRAELDNVSRALALLADMSGGNGERRYLIAVANPAEMRGAGGMILSYGVLESKDGTFTLGDFGGIDELALDKPVDPSSLELPNDYLARWGGLQPTLLWRNATVAPDFRFDAPAMEKMFTAKTGLPVNGVIQIDPAGLAAILTGTGPVEVPTVGQVTADNVVDLTLNRAYIDFPDRDQRQEVLGDVAKAAFNALIDGDFSSLRPFGEALFRAAGARHLILYADDQKARDEASFFGADGALPDAATQDYGLLTVQNFGQNKLDYYVDTKLDIVGKRPEGKAGSIAATITVTNTVPADLRSSYVMGLPLPGKPPGTYNGTVSLYLPSGTTLVDGSGSPQPPGLATEEGRTFVAYDVLLAPGETSVVTLHLSLSPRPAKPNYRFLLVPVPRVRPTVVSVDIDIGGGVRAQRPAGALTTPTPVVARRTG